MAKGFSFDISSRGLQHPHPAFGTPLPHERKTGKGRGRVPPLAAYAVG
jgi:hypothetical protein